jgi:aryl-alcohol dehydrogenase-like predicted oxidoreductase
MATHGMQYIPLYANGPLVSRIAMGCWPIAGITSLGVSEQSSIATVNKAIDEGVNFFDTAYSYGFDGESDRILHAVLSQRKEQIVIASKIGQHWNDQRQRVVDARPETMLKHTQECLRRLGVDCVDLMYLHAPDPNVPLSESAGALSDICQRGWARAVGVCNVNLEQATEINRYCKLSAIQIPFNMLQQDQHKALREFASQQQILIACYWIYMKGLLAGKLRRNHHFAPEDKRLSYEIFHGEAWERAQDLLDRLEALSADKKCAISQLVIAWSLQQTQVDVVLIGAKTPEQISESAKSHLVTLSQLELDALDGFISEATG